MIMGGGVTRAPGMLFGLLTMWAAHRMYSTRDSRYAAAAAGFGAAAVLCHIEMAWFTAFSSAVFFLASGRSRRDVMHTAAVVAAVVLLTSPWWLTVSARHGAGPFLAAADAGRSGSANPLARILLFPVPGSPILPFLSVIPLLGLLSCVARRRWLLPAWVLAATVLDPRSFGTVASVPMAMLAGVAVADVLVPVLIAAPWRRDLPPARSPALAASVLVVLAAYALLAAIIATPRLLTGFSPAEREALAWVAGSTPAGARFLVITDDAWAVDRTSEWFPVEAGRTSVATPQGLEWVRGDAYTRGRDAYRDAQRCADADGACLAAWSRETGIEFDHVYIPYLAPHSLDPVPPEDERRCCAALRAALRADPAYELLYDGAGATVFRRHD
jgi:hypothetical protein